MKRKSVINAGCSVLVLSVSCAVAMPPAFAQADAGQSASQTADSANLTEIVVTAQRRSEKLRDVPVTVSLISKQELEDSNVQSVKDIQKLLTGVRFDNASMWLETSIRGIGTNSISAGNHSNVGIYVDNFYNPNPGTADFNLLNVTGVQVLKGPQGTLFGRNTEGGAILVTTADPSLTPGGKAQVSYGSFNTVRADGYVTGGVTDNLALDLEALYGTSDGFWKDVLTNDDRIGAWNDWTLRAGAKLWLADNATAMFRYMHIQNDDPSSVMFDTYVGPNGPFVPEFTNFAGITTAPQQVAFTGLKPYVHQIDDIFQLTFELTFDWGTIDSYSQARFDKTLSGNNLTGVGNNLTVPIPIGIWLPLNAYDKTFSQEFLAKSAPGTRLQWTAGVFYFDNVDTYRVPGQVYFNPVPGTPLYSGFNVAQFLGGSSATSVSVAAYGDATYEFLDNWFFTAGLRFTEDQITNSYYYTNAGVGGTNAYQFEGSNYFYGIAQPWPTINTHHLSPRLVLRWKPDDQSSIYVSVSSGYKNAVANLGGQCVAGSNIPSLAGGTVPCTAAKPESIRAYEVGYKYAAPDFSVNLAAFYYDYRNLQYSYYVSPTVGPVENAGRVRLGGVEAQGEYHILPSLTVGGDLSYLEARAARFSIDPFYTANTLPPAGTPAALIPCYLGGGGSGINVCGASDFSGHRLFRAPSWTGDVSVRYETGLADGMLRLTANYNFTTKFFFDPHDEFPQDGYGLLGLRVEWTDPSGAYTVAVYGDNVTNSTYANTISYDSFGLNVNWAAPATWGMSLRYEF